MSEVITFGEAMIRLSPPNFRRLEQATSLDLLVANRAREAGVSTDYVLWTNDERVGVYFLEFGAAPRASSVVYDRKGAAIANIKPGAVPWTTIFPDVKWFHVTGITPALSASAAETTRE